MIPFNPETQTNLSRFPRKGGGSTVRSKDKRYIPPGNCNSFSSFAKFLPRHGPRARKFLFSLVQREGNFGAVEAEKKPLFRCFQEFLKLFRILLTTCLGKQVNVAPVSKRKAKKKAIERIRGGRDFLPPPHLPLPQIRKHFTLFFLSLAVGM